jgi:hypothetical protein
VLFLDLDFFPEKKIYYALETAMLSECCISLFQILNQMTYFYEVCWSIVAINDSPNTVISAFFIYCQ